MLENQPAMEEPPPQSLRKVMRYLALAVYAGFLPALLLVASCGPWDSWDRDEVYFSEFAGGAVLQRRFTFTRWLQNEGYDRIRMFGDIEDGNVVKPGMTKDRVESLLGEPTGRTTDDWTWEEEFHGIAADGSMVLHIEFVDGRVARVWIEDKLDYE